MVDVATAFADHVHEQAVFGTGVHWSGTHGREAIVRDWKGTIEGKTFSQRWLPGVVDIGGDGRMAISRGFTWSEDLRATTEAKWRYMVGEYTSTWIKDADGQWRVLFHTGGPGSGAAAASSAKAIG